MNTISLYAPPAAGSETQTAIGAGGRNSKSRCRYQLAQMMRASLLATATAALLWPLRARTRIAHSRKASSGRPARRAEPAEYRTARAPWTSSIRKYPSPRLLMVPRRRMLPDENSRGVRPSQEAKWRGLRNEVMSPTEPANAVALIRPIPGIFCSPAGRRATARQSWLTRAQAGEAAPGSIGPEPMGARTCKPGNRENHGQSMS